ncbi:hypothetical protein PG990_013304 [Apiospora arundinis]
MARQAVLSNWELVELILDYMDDVRDLLFFQRVSATWRRDPRQRPPARAALHLNRDADGQRRRNLAGYVTSEPQSPRALEPFPLWARWNRELLLLGEETAYEGVPLRNGRIPWSSSKQDNSMERKKKEPDSDRLDSTRRKLARHARVATTDPALRMGALYDLAGYAQWRTGVFKVGWRLYD